MREFSTAGPVLPEYQYCLPPLARLDLDEILGHIRGKRYFLLHAPRQSGKTTALLALRDHLNTGAAGDLHCVYASVQDAKVARSDVGAAMEAVLGELASEARALGDDFLKRNWRSILAEEGPLRALVEALTRWSEASPKPLVLLVDEIDAMVGDSLLSVFDQLKTGYRRRPHGFPQSVVACGLRNVDDYRIEWEEKAGLAGGSPFNILSESLRLGDFSDEEVAALLGQHTAETGQRFHPEAVETVCEQTRGQPWLVNALGYQACFRDPAGRERSRAITGTDIAQAREALILRRDTHIHQLAHRLREDRVRWVVEPLLSDAPPTGSARDVAYTRDLGLIARDPPVRIANPIYREVVPRELTAVVQEELVLATAPYITADGGLDAARLLGDFQQWFREHSGHWLKRVPYPEAAPQLLLQAYCQKVVNSRGRIERESAAGTGRIDLLFLWPKGGREQKFVIELKILRRSREVTEREGLEQTARYLDGCDADEGHLVIFDRDPEKSWDDRIFRKQEIFAGRPITVWGM